MIQLNGSCGLTTAGDVNFTSNSVSSSRWVTDCRSLHQWSAIWSCVMLSTWWTTGVPAGQSKISGPTFY